YVASAAEDEDAAPVQLPDAPEFDLVHSANKTATVGGSVILNCRVRHIGSLTVSWAHELQVLANGMHVFADPRRFKPLHQKYSDDWSLRIRSVRPSDAGLYLCQVGTTPPIAHYLYLTVIEPRVEIVGGPDLYINRGSNANLTCVIHGDYNGPNNVRWTHNNKLVQFDPSRSGVRVTTTHKEDRTISSFSIERALPSDSGEYFCDPDGLHQVKVIVHVLIDDHPAAMQTSGQIGLSQSAAASLLLLLSGTALLLGRG
ncbi:Down syndrome cell adhesion molecule-like, partial [Amphibalanus amphitrite]|uniref:Down syndrome cell adhesion molecule-like n=1 Tax=Amphibalanus amphitrite TaxID=1232801 RepID=UPI001C903D9A